MKISDDAADLPTAIGTYLQTEDGGSGVESYTKTGENYQYYHYLIVATDEKANSSVGSSISVIPGSSATVPSPLLATYDADIVRPKVTETFPRSWEERLVPLTDLQSVFCLDPHDMAATKCLVGRAKDKGQINFLIEKGYIKTELLKQRVSEISLSSTLLEKAHSFIQTLG